MDNKLLLIFILLFLSFLLLFYYLKLKSNIIMLLSIIVVLCINKLIIQKEYFIENENEHKYRQRDIIEYILNYGKKILEETHIKYDFIGSTPHPLSITTNTQPKFKKWRNVLNNMITELPNRPVIPEQIIPTLQFPDSISSK